MCPAAALQLAARIAVSNLHKSTLKSFTETWVDLRVQLCACNDSAYSSGVAAKAQLAAS